MGVFERLMGSEKKEEDGRKERMMWHLGQEMEFGEKREMTK